MNNEHACLPEGGADRFPVVLPRKERANVKKIPYIGLPAVSATGKIITGGKCA